MSHRMPTHEFFGWRVAEAYCLNDLHKSAGSQRSNDPHDWLRLKQTKELIEELTDTGIPVTTIRGGKNQGTYVCRELVFSYAMWINAKFHLILRKGTPTVEGGG